MVKVPNTYVRTRLNNDHTEISDTQTWTVKVEDKDYHFQMRREIIKLVSR